MHWIHLTLNLVNTTLKPGSIKMANFIILDSQEMNLSQRTEQLQAMGPQRHGGQTATFKAASAPPSPAQGQFRIPKTIIRLGYVTTVLQLQVHYSPNHIGR
jgi:hypothetical protein